MSSGLIVIKKAKLLIPQPYVEIICQQFKGGVIGSVMALEEEAGNPELVIADTFGDPMLLPHQFMELQKEQLDAELILWIGTGVTTPESVQPFTLVRGANNLPVLAALFEGEFFPERGKDEMHTDEYLVATKIIGPELQKRFVKYFGGDPLKLEDDLNDEETKTWIRSVMGNRGAAVLVSINGETFPVEKGNDLSGDFPEFWTSNKLGYMEQSSKDVAPEVKSKSAFGKVRTAIAEVVGISQKKDEKATTIATENEKSVVHNQTAVPAPETATAIPDDKQRPMISPPKDLLKKGKNEYFAWYDQNCTMRPTKEDARNGVAMPANDDWMAKNPGKFKPLKEGLKDLKEKVNGLSNTGSKYESFTPIISPENRSGLTALIASDKVKAKTQNVVLDPDSFKNEKAASFTEQLGLTHEDSLRWDMDVLKWVLETCLKSNQPDNILLLIAEHRNAELRLLKEAADMQKMLDDLTTPTKTKVEEPAKVVVASPPADTGTPVVKQKRFAR